MTRQLSRWPGNYTAKISTPNSFASSNHLAECTITLETHPPTSREAAAFEAMRGTADEKGAAARMSDMEDCVARWGAKASAGVGEPGH